MDVLQNRATLKLISISVLALGLSACSGGSSSAGGGDTTPADATAPAVSSTTPADTATAVARSSDLTATFNEDMFATTVDTSSFTLANASSTNITGSVTFDGATNVATFSPGSALAVLASYTATLTTGITDLSGNSLVTDYIWSFTTADGSWGSAELIEATSAGTAFGPQIAFDASDSAVAVWRQSDGARNNIWSSRFDGSSWSSAELIETDDAGSADSPQIAVDDSGNAIAVWEQYDRGHYNLLANRFDGSNWGTAELLETGNPNSSAAQIAFDASGNALVVWSQSDGIHKSIWSNRFDGSNWGTAELIEAGDAGGAYGPQIAFDSSGNALAVWSQRDGSGVSIWSNRFDGSSWGNAELIETDNAGDAQSPQIAIDASGNAIAVWQQYDGSRWNIWSNRFDGSSWGTAELIEVDNRLDSIEPQIAMDGSGNALAVWSQFTEIWSSRFDGSNWGVAELIEVDNSGWVYGPQIAFDARGNALAVWHQNDGARNNIWSNRFDGNGWGIAELIETDNVGSALQPQIAVDAGGKGLAVWYQSDGISYSIRFNRFE